MLRFFVLFRKFSLQRFYINLMIDEKRICYDTGREREMTERNVYVKEKRKKDRG